MQRIPKVVAAAAIVVVAVSSLAYAVYTSSPPGLTGCSPAPANRPLASPIPPRERTAVVGERGLGQPLGPAEGSAGDPAAASRGPAPAAVGGSGPGTTIEVVSAENFWGSLVAQLGGNRTSVTSIVSDPNADPHEYEANTTDAVLFSNAAFVIVNGVGYDDWATRLIAADGNPDQVVLDVGHLNGVTAGAGVLSGNPHMWYNPVYVNRTVAAMYSDLAGIDPAGTTYFQHQYSALNASLASLFAQASEVRRSFAGTPVAATEDIFVYLANYTGLDLISPVDFMQAVAEGNDPPAQAIVTFECQLEEGQVKVLVFNEQTVTPLTTSIQAIATQHNVSLVGVTETIQPPGATFEAWMSSELLALENALNAHASGG